MCKIHNVSILGYVFVCLKWTLTERYITYIYMHLQMELQLKEI